MLNDYYIKVAEQIFAPIEVKVIGNSVTLLHASRHQREIASCIDVTKCLRKQDIIDARALFVFETWPHDEALVELRRLKKIKCETGVSVLLAQLEGKE